ncbi:MAG: hypothetical protein LBS03_04050 [Bacteroidales bacterium]|nr:hypothetical protein [Bacteroidales bacterium]
MILFFCACTGQPDSIVEWQYDVLLYGMASTSRDTNFPPGLFGIWITQEQPAWAGSYHLNYNYQASFYGLYSANRMEQIEPYCAPLLAFIPRGKYYSEKITNIPDGILLGAFLVSSSLKNGEVTELSIYSEQGRPLCLLNPWKGRSVRVCELTGSKRTGEYEYSGERINMPTKPDTMDEFLVGKETGKNNEISLNC